MMAPSERGSQRSSAAENSFSSQSEQSNEYLWQGEQVAQQKLETDAGNDSEKRVNGGVVATVEPKQLGLKEDCQMNGVGASAPKDAPMAESKRAQKRKIAAGAQKENGASPKKKPAMSEAEKSSPLNSDSDVEALPNLLQPLPAAVSDAYESQVEETSSPKKKRASMSAVSDEEDSQKDDALPKMKRRKKAPASHEEDGQEEDSLTDSFQPLYKKPTPALAALYGTREYAKRKRDAEAWNLAEAQRVLEEAQQAFTRATESVTVAEKVLQDVTDKVRQAELLEPSHWNGMLGKLKEFVATHGHARVPLPEKCEKNTDLRELSNWIQRQKRHFNGHRGHNLSETAPHRVKALQELGVSFNIVEDRWNQRYQELVAYQAETGTLKIRCNDQQNQQLRLWSVTQKEAYRNHQKGLKSHITPERIRLLREIGFKFEKRAGWEDRFEELAAHRAEHGHCRPGQVPGNRTLQRWVDDQRALYRLWMRGQPSKGQTDERRLLLEGIGFCWTRCQCEAAKGLGRGGKKVQEC